MEEEADDSVAEDANAVVEEQGTTFDVGLLGFGHLVFDSLRVSLR
jgi:hypothetical protein